MHTAHTVLKSPIDCVVQGFVVPTPGQVVQSGEEIMQVVPRAAGLEIEAYLPNGDVGFVHAGQDAVVKLDSFPFMDYGTLDAKVVRVARDAIPLPDAEAREGNPILTRRGEAFGGGQRVQNLVFPVTLALDLDAIRIDGADVLLGPGMAVTVEVKTGTRLFPSCVLAPSSKPSQPP